MSDNGTMKNPIRRIMKSGFFTLSVFALGIAGAAAQSATALNPRTLAPPNTLSEIHVGESTTLLPDGKQLLLGGQGADKKATAQGRVIGGVERHSSPLPTEMNFARSGHTATVLPNGLVLVLGGVGKDGRVVESVELFDPIAKSFAVVSGLSLLARTDHSATVMTDGRVLIAGGIGGDGRVLREVEVLDTATGKVERINPELETARFGHVAALLPSSPVLLRGGYDENDRAIESAELFDPVAQRFLAVPEVHRFLLQSPFQDDNEPTITGGIPLSGAIDFPIDSRVSVRFSTHLQMTSLNDSTVVLYGPTGVVATTVVPAESGLLVFVTPDTELQPGTQYTLFLNGPTDEKNRRLPFSAIGFRTAVLPAGPRSSVNSFPAGAVGSSSDQAASAGIGTQSGPTGVAGDRQQGSPLVAEDDEEWIPGPQHFRGDWRARRVVPAFSKALPQAPAGVTALSGLVSRLNGKPLRNATLSIGNRNATSDEHGQFLLTEIPAGVQTLVIEGKTANRADATYGYFESVVRINAGQTNALPFTIWMSKLDTNHVIKIPSPTTEEVVLTTPRIPGFEVRIPAGVVLRDRRGKIVTEIGITAVPIDRTPFPQPQMDFPVYYTVQPGGVVVQSVEGRKIKPAQLIYPNYVNAPAGTRADVWLYDPHEKGWYVYGKATVSADGAVLQPDADVGLYEFTGGGFSFPPDQPDGPPPCDGITCCPEPSPGGPFNGSGGNGPTPPCNGGAGVGSAGSDVTDDPVSLSSGAFIQSERDLAVNDIVPISVLRIYHSKNTNLGPFGKGWSSPLNWYLYSVNTDQTKVSLVLPNGTRILYNLIAGTFWLNGLYQHTTSAGDFYLSTLQSFVLYDGTQEWLLKLKDGRTYSFAHYGARLVRFADRFGNSTVITRSNDVITRVTGPTGRYLSFTANADGTISQVSDATGRTYSYAYQGGYLTSVTDPAGGTRFYTYDVNNRLRTVKDPTGNIVVTNDYDVNGRVMTQTFANGSTMQFAYTLDTGGKVTQSNVTDQRGNVRQVNFDSLGYIVSSTYPLGKPEQQITTFSRDPATGTVNFITDPLNRVTAYSYDTKGNIASITRLAGTPNAVTTSYTYEPIFNQLASRTDPLNHTWTIGFDNAANPVTLTNPLGHVASRAYNASGQLISITDANSNTASLTYAGADLVSVTDPLGRVKKFFTDAIGRQTYITDSIALVRRTDYDSLDRVIKHTAPSGDTITFGYDAANRLTSHLDQKGNQTTYSYGPLGYVTARSDALNRADSTSYDLAGNASRLIDRKSQVTGVTYDNLNRVSQVGFGATVAAPTTYASAVNYSYDAGDRAIQIVDSVAGSITRTYDGLDRLTQEQTPEGTVSFTYDAAGRRNTMTVTGQSAIVYAWDNANRLTQISQGSDVIAFNYDNGGRRTSITLANGVVMAYAYDSANQLTSITYTKGGTTIGDLAYTYDAGGRRTSVSGSLAKADLPAAVASAVYNANNQLVSWGGSSNAYDLNGNLISDGSRTYTWNERDQLSAISGIATASFSYDGLGRRKSKTVGGIQTAFLYDGINLVQELTAGTATANLISGGIDELFMRKEATSTSHPITDGIGSVIGLTDSSGVMQTEYSYEAYGKATLIGAANSNSQTFTAREDDGTGLLFYRARYYAAGVSRFISEDPIGVDGGINLYEYVEGSPLNWSDPMGLAKGGKRNLNTEGLTKKSDPKDVEEAMKRHPKGSPAWRALRGLLKVIKRGGTYGLVCEIVDEYWTCQSDPCSCDPYGLACLLQSSGA